MKTYHKFLILLSIAHSLTFAQVDTLSLLNADELYNLARIKAFSGQRDSARMILRTALKKSPKYTDLRILLARTYSWDGLRDSSRNEFFIVLGNEPDNKDALNGAIDNEVWEKNQITVLALSNQALKYYPNDEEFIFKKARALRDLGREEESLLLLSKLEDINQSNPNIELMRESIQLKSNGNTVAVSYSDDIFIGKSPHHLAYIQYSRNTKYGSIIGRVNYAYRFQSSGIQYEVEGYPKIINGLYGYLNYGYSNALFSKHRAGAEAFFQLPSNFESSFGLRYLYFSSSTMIYTGSLGYYYRDYWFSFRPYITRSNGSFSNSAGVTIRRYFSSADDYLSVRFSTGFSPDESKYELRTPLLKSQSFGIGYQYSIDFFSIINAEAGYADQELSANNRVYPYSFSVIYKYKF